MREILEVNIDGTAMIGTHHVPISLDRASAYPRHGVLLLNFGQVSRASVGDLSVRCADAMCAAGLPAYRFDFPGLGDTPGELPEREETFFGFLQGGGHSDLTRRIVETLGRDESIERMIVIGMCATAWTAMFVAEENPAIAGLVLLDPEFTTSAAPPGSRGSAPNRRSSRIRAWLTAFNARAGLVGEDRLASMLNQAGRIRTSFRRFTRKGLPPDTHQPLLRCLQRLVAEGMPMLVVTAAGGWREQHAVRIFKHVADRCDASCLHHVSLPGTNHIFTAGDGPERLRQALTAWVGDRCPVDPSSVTHAVTRSHEAT